MHMETKETVAYNYKVGNLVISTIWFNIGEVMLGVIPANFPEEEREQVTNFLNTNKIPYQEIRITQVVTKVVTGENE